MRWLLTLCQSVCSGLSPFPIPHVYLDNRQTNWLSDPSCNKCCYRLLSATCRQYKPTRCFNNLPWKLREMYKTITLTFTHISISIQRIVFVHLTQHATNYIKQLIFINLSVYCKLISTICIIFIMGDIQTKLIQEKIHLPQQERRTKNINSGGCPFLWEVSCFGGDSV